MKKQEVNSMKFLSGELGIMLFILKFSSMELDNSTKNYPTRKFDEVDQLTALEIFRELKKALDVKTGSFKPTSLSFTKEQKEFLVSIMKGYKVALEDIEYLISALNKLV